MDLGLAGKRALVTGGSRGIGLAIARTLAQEGVRVVLAARNEEGLRTASNALAAETGAEVLTVCVDTGSQTSVARMVEQVISELDGIDILVNNAAAPGGQSRPPKLAETTDELFWEDINIKVMGYLRCARAVAPHMAAHGWGRIINIAGVNARRTGSIVGSIRNASVTALTKNLADELGPSGINVTVVHPALTRTEMTPSVIKRRAEASGLAEAEIERRMSTETVIGRIVDAQEVAYVVTFLASPKSVAITGDGIACGGGVKGSIHY
jgi:NAD(P)-dependent dehydrogenase (short-subunit alcohol dehydrogenase family)